MSGKPSRYINRELSWLEFNHRVLEEARNSDTPLLERLKFLAITASNLDEFFMVRVGGLQQLAQGSASRTDPAGMSASEQLEAISERTHQMAVDQYTCYLDDVEPKLAENGISRIRTYDATEQQQTILEQVFENEIYPVLTPMAVTSVDEFPLLADQALNVCVRLKPDVHDSDEPRYAVIPFGRAVSRFITLPSDGGYCYMLLEDIVELFASRFFPGEEIVECVPFRITRNADLGIREDMASDLLSEIEDVIDARKEATCVRLELSDRVTSALLEFLQKTLSVADADVYATPGPLDLSSMMRLTDLKGFDSHKYEAWPPRPSPSVDLTQSIFDVIAQNDVLLYHPYESFEPVLRLIEDAADDPDVLAIKQTLYRTSRDSPIVAALVRAAERGKYVTVIVELKARFDEARNIEWARNLEHAGVQVIYGVKGLKTHAKVCVIVRREPRGIVRYAHFGTGNYNESTARLYSDASLMTCDPDLGADATSFFNSVTGYSQPQRFRKIEAAPIGLREKVIEMIETETERKRQGQKARILAKLNSLVDPDLIEALYAASEAGVEIKLNVRGICCLRPGVEGLSENISVVSIVDRFLEHSRILFFHHGGDERVFISSADWMPRNLDRRVELLVPVEEPSIRRRLIHILTLYFRDNVKAWHLKTKGAYRQIKPKKGKKTVRSQEALYREACDALAQAQESRRAIFEPYRAPEKTA